MRIAILVVLMCGPLAAAEGAPWSFRFSLGSGYAETGAELGSVDGSEEQSFPIAVTFEAFKSWGVGAQFRSTESEDGVLARNDSIRVEDLFIYAMATSGSEEFGFTLRFGPYVAGVQVDDDTGIARGDITWGVLGIRVDAELSTPLHTSESTAVEVYFGARVGGHFGGAESDIAGNDIDDYDPLYGYQLGARLGVRARYKILEADLSVGTELLNFGDTDSDDTAARLSDLDVQIITLLLQVGVVF